MDETITRDKEFKDLVHIIRGQQVMLDSDLAELYGTEVKKLIQQVKRNIEKFPYDFMFQLTIEEAYESLRSQNVTLKKRGSHIKYAPYAFTEQGVYMVSTILKNDIATKQTIYIMRSYKKMKHFLAENNSLLKNTELLNIHTRLDKHEADINKIMDNFIHEENIKEKLFLNGQIFDAVEAYIDLYRKAKQHIYIIDDYINIDTLRLLKHKQYHVDVTFFTSNKGTYKITKSEIIKFNMQYPMVSMKYTNKAHDRFIIIDYGTENELFYLCGASSKDAGQKICTITQLYNSENLHTMVDTLLESSEYIFYEER